jgi:hypothetical protein
MEKAGWDAMNNSTDTFASDFTKLDERVEGGKLYLICAKRPSSDIGHMVVLTTNDDASHAYITDAQKQPINYGLYKFVGWLYGDAPMSRPRPYREVDLSTGKFIYGSTWTN